MMIISIIMIIIHLVYYFQYYRIQIIISRINIRGLTYRYNGMGLDGAKHLSATLSTVHNLRILQLEYVTSCLLPARTHLVRELRHFCLQGQ